MTSQAAARSCEVFVFLVLGKITFWVKFVVLALGNDLGDAALVEELLSKVGQLPDQLPQRGVQLALVRGGGDQERLLPRVTFDDRLDHPTLLALNGDAQGGLLVRVAEVVQGHGGLPSKSLDSDENFKPKHTLFCRKLRFVALYVLFGNLCAKKVPFWVKNSVSWARSALLHGQT